MFAPNSFHRYENETLVLAPIEVRDRTIVVLKSRSYMKPDDRSADADSASRTRAALESNLAAAGGGAEAAALENERRLLDRAPRDHVDRAAEGVGTEERRARSVQDLDALDGVERHRNVAVVMARLRVVQTHAVDEHEHLTEVRAAHGEVGLHAADAAHPHVDRRRQSQHVGDRLHRQPRNLLARDDRHPARDGCPTQPAARRR